MERHQLGWKLYSDAKSHAAVALGVAFRVDDATVEQYKKFSIDLEAASVMKRMKDKAFARAVSRDDLRQGAEELGLSLDVHAANVISFLREEADALGLRGTL